MMIALARVMARSTPDLSETLLERWLELRRCFFTQNSLTPLSTNLQQLLLILILLFYLSISSRANIDKQKSKIKINKSCCKFVDNGVSEFQAKKQRRSSSHRSKSVSERSGVERAITLASAIVIFSFLVSLVFRWCSLGSTQQNSLANNRIRVILAPKI